MNKKWWNDVGRKTIETMISVKVLTIAAVLTISTYMVYDGKMDGATFAQLNGALIGTVYALREGFKIMSVKEYNNGNGNDEKNGKCNIEEHKRMML